MRLWWREGKRRSVLLPHGWLFPGPSYTDGKGAGERLAKAMDAVEFYLHDGDAWLCGDRPSVPAGHLATCLFYFEAIGIHHGAPGVIAARPRISAWWKYAKADPLMARLLAEQDAAFWPVWKDVLPVDYARRNSAG